MRKLGKKLMALTMAGVMMCSSMTVFAADTTDPADAKGGASGTGEFEGYLDEKDKIFKVVLPTDNDTTTFAFTMDPQQLLLKTSADPDTSPYKDAGTVIFKNIGPTGDGSDDTYSDTSDSLKVTNKSMFDVDLTLTAKMTGLTDSSEGYDIKMATLDEDGNITGTDTSLYLGLIYSTTDKDGVDIIKDKEEALTDAESGISVKATIGSALDTAYTVKKSGSTYSYEEVTTAQTKPEDYYKGIASFKLTGKCNANADWSKLDDATAAAPKVEVTWTLAKHSDSFLSAASVSTSSPSVTVTLPEDATKISSVVLTKTDATTKALTAGTLYTYSGSTLTIKDTVLSGNIGGSITVTLDNGATATLSIN